MYWPSRLAMARAENLRRIHQVVANPRPGCTRSPSLMRMRRTRSFGTFREGMNAAQVSRVMTPA